MAWVDAAASQEPEADAALALAQKAWSRTKRRADMALEKAWVDVASSHEPYM